MPRVGEGPEAFGMGDDNEWGKWENEGRKWITRGKKQEERYGKGEKEGVCGKVHDEVARPRGRSSRKAWSREETSGESGYMTDRGERGAGIGEEGREGGIAIETLQGRNRCF